ncbi:MAG TPA: FAD-dependent oxidoreductase [Micromonosporaceae bacterium]|nr:FAD-dependent oxidoreductase [Micromonosporaceae bacterium]
MDTTMKTPTKTTTMRADTVVVGAGQTGLATAYHLKQRGIDAVVLDEHPRVGDQWRVRYDSLRLNTPAKYDALPGMKFPADDDAYPTGGDMADYLSAYVDRFGLDVRHRSHVTSVRRQDDGDFVVQTDSTTFLARNVVMATGCEHHPSTPDLAAELDPDIRQLHSSAYHGPGQLLPGPVLVVGVGQSGADLALEAANAGHDTWLSGKPSAEVPFEIGSRRAKIILPVLWFVANHVLTLKTPIGRRLQPKIRKMAAPLIRTKLWHLTAAGVHLAPARTVASRDGRPMLADGQILDVANVIWCTGFKQDWTMIDPPVVGSNGWPSGEGGVVHDVPGLYFVGLLFQRGFYSMLIGGAGRDGRFIARQIAGRRRAETQVDAPVAVAA